MKTSITQIWMVCHLLPFAKVGQYAQTNNQPAPKRGLYKFDINPAFNVQTFAVSLDYIHLNKITTPEI